MEFAILFNSKSLMTMKKIRISHFIFLFVLLFSSQLFSQTIGNEIETKSLDELYEEAINEGGEFILRAGGDKPDQIDYYMDMFKARFPKINVTHTVDVSINHAPRYDNARSAGGEKNIPDIQFIRYPGHRSINIIPNKYIIITRCYPCS